MICESNIDLLTCDLIQVSSDHTKIQIKNNYTRCLRVEKVIIVTLKFETITKCDL